MSNKCCSSFRRKLKPDYELLSQASDLDLVIIGGYFATGMHRTGLISQFLLASVERDFDGSTSYHSVTRISGRGKSLLLLLKNLNTYLTSTRLRN